MVDGRCVLTGSLGLNHGFPFLPTRSKRKGFVYYAMGQITQVARQFYKTHLEIEIISEEESMDMTHVIMKLHFQNNAFRSTFFAFFPRYENWTVFLFVHCMHGLNWNLWILQGCGWRPGWRWWWLADQLWHVLWRLPVSHRVQPRHGDPKHRVRAESHHAAHRRPGCWRNVHADTTIGGIQHGKRKLSVCGKFIFLSYFSPLQKLSQG